MSQDFQIEKHILIVKIKKGSLVPVESFLEHREWKIKSTVSLKEALLYMVSSKPPFVMVALDHPHPKVRSLPRVLQSTFGCCVIVFTEASNTVNYKMIMNSSAEYKLFPPTTGPGVERVVNKYIRDKTNELYKVDEVKRKAKAEGRNITHEEAVIAVKGKINAGMMGGGNSNVSSDKMASMLSQMMDQSPEDESSSSSDGELDKDVANYLGSLGGVEDEKNPKKSGIGYMSSLDTKNKSNGDVGYNPLGNQEESEDSTPNFLKSNQGKKAFDDNNAPLFAPGDGGKKKSSESPDAVYTENDYDPTTGKLKRWGNLGSNGGAGNQDENGSPGWFGAGKENDPTKEVSSIYQQKRKISGGNEGFEKESSLISEGTSQALSEVSVKGDGTVQEDLADSSNVACIMVESPKFSGYLVAALGKNRKIDTKFINQIQLKLIKFLTERGEMINKEDSLNIKIKQVDFEDWAIDYAEFLKKSVHNGEEVAMAFFPRAEVKVKMEASKKEEMVSIKIEEFKGDVAVDFNVYVYLPANDKYVLYTPRGGTLGDGQKSRLMAKGVTHFHMHKTEVQDLNKYRVQNYFNDMISEHEAIKQNAESQNSEKNSSSTEDKKSNKAS